MCKKVASLSDTIKKSTKGQLLILEDDSVESVMPELLRNRKRYEELARFIIQEALRKSAFVGIQFLNTPQMWNGFYKPHRSMQDSVHNGDCIYTPEVVMMKSDTAEPKLLPEKEWYEVNVVTCTAPNLRLIPANKMNVCDSKKPVKMTEKEQHEIKEIYRECIDEKEADNYALGQLEETIQRVINYLKS